ncbi:MAG: GNAT family N-acetyltransferase [Flavobacteriales bacterium]|nr:GNAT family N-acetyltransferase [Flavobacteriales bacterium]
MFANMMFESIHTARLVLRTLKSSDAKRLLAIYSNDKAMAFRANPPMRSLDQALEMIEENKKAGFQRIGTTLKLTNELIGTFMFDMLDKHIAKIGYSFDQPYWNQGFAKETLGAMLKYLVDKEVREIKAVSHKQNIWSVRLLKSFGFYEETHENELLYLSNDLENHSQ